MSELEDLVHSYPDWLNEQMMTRQVKECLEITVPFLDYQNDWIQLYVKKQSDDSYLITDAGYTISDLTNNEGVSLALLHDVLLDFDIELINNDEITLSTSKKDFASKLNRIIQTIISLNALKLV